MASQARTSGPASLWGWWGIRLVAFARAAVLSVLLLLVGGVAPAVGGTARLGWVYVPNRWGLGPQRLVVSQAGDSEFTDLLFLVTDPRFTAQAWVNGNGLDQYLQFKLGGIVLAVTGEGRLLLPSPGATPPVFIPSGPLAGYVQSAGDLDFVYHDSPGLFFGRLDRIRPRTGAFIGCGYWEDRKVLAARLTKISETTLSYFPYVTGDAPGQFGGYSSGRLRSINDCLLGYYHDAGYGSGRVDSVSQPPPEPPVKPFIRFQYFHDAGPRSGRISKIGEVGLDYSERFDPNMDVDKLKLQPEDKLLQTQFWRPTINKVTDIGKRPPGVSIVVENLPPREASTLALWPADIVGQWRRLRGGLAINITLNGPGIYLGTPAGGPLFMGVNRTDALTYVGRVFPPPPLAREYPWGTIRLFVWPDGNTMMDNAGAVWQRTTPRAAVAPPPAPTPPAPGPSPRPPRAPGKRLPSGTYAGRNISPWWQDLKKPGGKQPVLAVNEPLVTLTLSMENGKAQVSEIRESFTYQVTIESGKDKGKKVTWKHEWLTTLEPGTLDPATGSVSGKGAEEFWKHREGELWEHRKGNAPWHILPGLDGQSCALVVGGMPRRTYELKVGAQ